MGPVDEAYQPTSRREEKPEPTKWEKIELFCKVATVLVAVVGLCITFYFNYKTALINKDTLEATKDQADKNLKATDEANKANQKLAADAQAATYQHNEQSVRPFLDFKYRFGLDKSEYKEGGRTYFEKEGFLRLANIGDGLAEITEIKATFDGDDIKTTFKALDAKVKKELPQNDQIVSNTLKIGQGISPGQQVTIFLFTPKGPQDGTSVCNKGYERRVFASKLKITVTYKSKYDKYKEAVFDYDVGESDCKPQTPAERAKLRGDTS